MEDFRQINDLSELTNLSNSVTSVRFGICLKINKSLIPGMIPEQILSLDLGMWFNQELIPGMLPKCLQELKLSYEYDKPINPGVLPRSLKFLYFGHHWQSAWQSAWQSTLPSGSEVLKFVLVPSLMPCNLRILGFGNQAYNQTLEPKDFDSNTYPRTQYVDKAEAERHDDKKRKSNESDNFCAETYQSHNVLQHKRKECYHMIIYESNKKIKCYE